MDEPEEYETRVARRPLTSAVAGVHARAASALGASPLRAPDQRSDWLPLVAPSGSERGRNGCGCAAPVGLPVALGRLLEGLASSEEGIQGGAGPVDVAMLNPSA